MNRNAYVVDHGHSIMVPTDQNRWMKLDISAGIVCCPKCGASFCSPCTHQGTGKLMGTVHRERKREMKRKLKELDDAGVNWHLPTFVPCGDRP